MAKQQLDHLALVAADAERSLAGLSHSLKRGPMGMSQGALHSRDLASALSTLGLETVSKLADDMARQMLLGQPSILEVAQSLVPLIAKAVRDIQLGEPTALDHQYKQWSEWSQRLQALESHTPAKPNQFEAVVPKQLAQTAPSMSAAPLPTSNNTSNTSIPTTTSPSAVTMPSSNDPGVQAVRRHGLSLIEQARIANQQDDDRSVRQIDALLSELQDWTVRVGQVPIDGVYALSQNPNSEVWLDPAIHQKLRTLDDLAARASHIQTQTRSLIIYMDWHNVNFSISEMDRIAHCTHTLRGQVRRHETGIRLILPCSLARARLVPFSLNGQLYAASAAQLLQVTPAEDASGQQQLLLRSGQTAKSLLVDHVLPQRTMNLFDIPSSLSHPQWLWAVALDGSGDVHFCVSPV